MSSPPSVTTELNSNDLKKKYTFLLLILVTLFVVYIVSKYTMSELFNKLPYVNDAARQSSVLEQSMEETLRNTYKYLTLSEMYVGYSSSEDDVEKLKLLSVEVNAINDEYWGLIRATNKKLMDFKTDISDNTFIYWGIINDDVSKQFESNIVSSVANIAKKLNTVTSGFANKSLPIDSEYSMLLENAGIGAEDLSSHLQYIKNNADAYKNVTAQLVSTTDHIDNINPRLGLYAGISQEQYKRYGKAPLNSEPSEYIKQY